MTAGFQAGAMLIVMSATAACRPAPPYTAVAPDNSTIVEVTKQRGQLCVVVGGRREGCHQRLALGWLTFDATGRHVAYPAGSGSQWTMVHNGVPGAAWTTVGKPVLSPRGGRIAYAAQRDGRWHAVVDGVVGPAFDSIHAGSLVFSATGRRVAYAGVVRDSVVVLIDGVSTGRWRAAGPVRFNTEETRWAHTVRVGARWHVASDAGVGSPFDEIGPLVLGRGDAIAFAGRTETGWHVRTVDRAFGPYANVRALALSPTGGIPVFIARVAGREALVRGGHAARWHDSVSHHVEAPDGAWGYLAYDGDVGSGWIGEHQVAADGTPVDLALGAGGRHAVMLRRDSVAVIASGGREYQFDVVVAGSLQYIGPDTWAALAGTRRTRELFVIVDGHRVGRPFDWVEMTRRIQSGNGGDAIRSWVAAEAALHREP